MANKHQRMNGGKCGARGSLRIVVPAPREYDPDFIPWLNRQREIAAMETAMLRGVIPASEPRVPVSPPAPAPVAPAEAPGNFRHTEETPAAYVYYSVGLRTGRGTATVKLKAGGQRVIALTRDSQGRWFTEDGGRHEALEKAIYYSDT